ncbi:MAG: autotransporter-associated beta strand repeat-containing protein [Verrucomicrobiota bacterium]
MSTPKARLTLLAALLSLSAAGSSASAATFYWGQTTYSSGSIYNGNAATAGNWFTDAAGTSVAGAAPDSLTDDLVFNTTPANAVGGTVTVAASLSAQSLTFSTSGATTLSQSGNQSLIIGGGGVTLGASSGSVSLGGTTDTLTTRVSSDQTWTNNSSSTLTARNLATDQGSGGGTLTLNAASTGGILFSFNVFDYTDDQLAVVVASTGTGYVTFNGSSNTYRGGTIIKSGNVRANGTLGSGDVLLGDTTGSANARIDVRPAGSATFDNNVVVRSGSSGTKTIVTNSLVLVQLNGSITLNDSVAILTATDGTFNGVISGTGDIVKTGSGALTFNAANTFSGDLTISAGAFTLTDTGGELTFYIGANGVNNQVNGATTGAVAFDGTFSFNLDGAELVDGNSWTLVSLASTAETYGSSFAITGFTEVDDVWTNGAGLTFTEATGILSYTAAAVPEPASAALIGGICASFFILGRRRDVRSALRG